MKTKFKDKNGKSIKYGDTCQTIDKKGKKWVGEIIKVKTTSWEGPAFLTNYSSWIHNQKYASTLEIVNENL